ncbi:MAG: carboxypeptidase-like regulatory domain-containing protein [Bacteroidota bacterium]|nr:carboxypeptidase-like regulatory domain-containing protein [Bacteroidota bacterium]
MTLKRLFFILFSISILASNPGFAGNDHEETATVQGVVLDESGEPLAGVAIRVQGFSGIIYTNLDGQFEIPFPKSGKVNVSVSTISYKEKQLQLDPTSNKGSKNLTISLEPQGSF